MPLQQTNNSHEDEVSDLLQRMTINDRKKDLTKNSFNSLNIHSGSPRKSSTAEPFSPVGTDADYFKPVSVKDKSWGKKINLNKYRNATVKGSIETTGFAKYSKEKQTNMFKPSVDHMEGKGFLDSAEKLKTEKQEVKSLLSQLQDDYITESKDKSRIDLSEGVIDGLNVDLMAHQIDGLKFLKRRESDKIFRKGGLLCDDMGLGKTVQTLALMVSCKPTIDELRDKSDIEKAHEDDKICGLYGLKENCGWDFSNSMRKLKGTLIICPVALTNQWLEEIASKSKDMKALVFHGPQRTKSISELAYYDIVITSYHTCMSEFQSSKSPLFRGYWHRIVLDEAHTIKNQDSKISIACRNLKSLRRWCLTGTPIQNNIGELQALFVFLRINKYWKKTTWNEEIGDLTTGNVPRGLETLRKELNTVMLRRTKQILNKSNQGIKLPPKNIHREILEFTEFEQEIYQRLEKKVVNELLGNMVVDELTVGSLKLRQNVFDDFNNDKSLEPKDGENDNEVLNVNYMCAFVFLLRLRQVCCHWRLMFEFDQSDLESIDGGLQQEGTKPKKAVTGVDELNEMMSRLDVGQEEETPQTEKYADQPEFLLNSVSKINRAISLLKKDPSRKTIIFSQFTSLLTLLEPVLGLHNIKFVRYDGSMSKIKKDSALHQLREDPETTVLLCSLKAGAFGLNLTCCSQVILYDPFWNPSIGDQAIDRAYRIGQTRTVDVYELFMNDSVEVRIMKLQDRKRAIARAVTDNDSEAIAKLISQRLTKEELLSIVGIDSKTLQSGKRG